MFIEGRLIYIAVVITKTSLLQKQLDFISEFTYPNNTEILALQNIKDFLLSWWNHYI